MSRIKPLGITDLTEITWKDHDVHIRREIDGHYQQRSPCYIVENCNTIERCEEVIDQFATIHGVKVVAVDYLQLLGGRLGSRYEVVTEISRRLKQAARRNEVAMIVLSQLNRELEKRDGKMPKLSDLRESGQIEQDADLVIFLQWPVKFDVNADEDLYRIYVAKRRNGAIRQPLIETSFDPHRQVIGTANRVAAFDDWNKS